jgi:hypothetical protein
MITVLKYCLTKSIKKALKVLQQSHYENIQLFYWPGLKDMIRILNDRKNRIEIRLFG